MKKTDLLKPGGSRGLQLGSLAREINESEDVIQSAKDQIGSRTKSFLCEVLLQGKRLMQAKEIVGHGNFLRWLTSHCPLISERTARVYMRIAANWQSSAVLEEAGSLSKALQLIASGDQPRNGTLSPKSWPAYIEALGRAARFIGYVQRNPLHSWPMEGKEKLREELLPVASALWPDKFA